MYKNSVTLVFLRLRNEKLSEVLSALLCVASWGDVCLDKRVFMSRTGQAAPSVELFRNLIHESRTAVGTVKAGEREGWGWVGGGGGGGGEGEVEGGGSGLHYHLHQ